MALKKANRKCGVIKGVMWRESEWRHQRPRNEINGSGVKMSSVHRRKSKKALGRNGENGEMKISMAAYGEMKRKSKKMKEEESEEMKAKIVAKMKISRKYEKNEMKRRKGGEEMANRKRKRK
jgi:hypothetical protein